MIATTYNAELKREIGEKQGERNKEIKKNLVKSSPSPLANRF